MRRTRHVVLPVRSWQYIGLLIVSLACLTLGLVARDREGHAGSLAGPELTHQAPHEVDACPNLKPFVKSPISEPEEATKSFNGIDHEIKVSEVSRASPSSQKSVLSQARSLDSRLSRSDSQETRERLSGNRDLRTTERLSRSRTRDDEFINRFRESRSRTVARFRSARSSLDPATRLSRSDQSDRRSIEQNFERRQVDPVNSRLENRQSRSTERREQVNEIARRQNRIDQSAYRRDSLQRRMSDRSLLTGRQNDRQESREVLAGHREYRDLARNRIPNHRSEIRERRSVERRVSIEHRDAEQSERRENHRNLADRSTQFARGDTDRNNNLDRRNRERSLENHRALPNRVAANQERRSRFSVATRGSRGESLNSDGRRASSRSMERSNANDFNRETLARRVRSVDSNRSERSEERERSSMERRSLVRSMERRAVDRRKTEHRFGDRNSFERVSRGSFEDLGRERTDRSQRAASRRDSRGNAATRENHRLTRSRYHVEEIASREQRERFAGASHSVDRNSVDRREIARTRDSGYESREERRVVHQRSREAERRAPERRISERRASERRIALDSQRSSERRIDDGAKSREEFRLADRRSERSPELRVSRERILEKQTPLDSRRTSERRVDDNLQSRGSRLTDRRLERNSALRVSRERIIEKRSALDSQRSLDQRVDDSLQSHRFRLTDRRSERRDLRNPELRVSREKNVEKRSTLDSQRLSREESKLAARRSERNQELRVSRERILERRSLLDLQRLSERRIQDGSRSREGSRMQDRRVERSSELRNSISILPLERRANSRTSLENQALRSSETQREVRRDFKERQMARSVENRPAEFRKRESIRHSRQRSARNVEDSSKLSSFRRVAHVPEQNREQRRLSIERTLFRTIDNERLSAKWERNLQDARVERNAETRATIIPHSMKNSEFFKYSMTYDLVRQAFVMALCTVYGLSFYNGKKSFLGSNIMQHAQRFIIW